MSHRMCVVSRTRPGGVPRALRRPHELVARRGPAGRGHARGAWPRRSPRSRKGGVRWLPAPTFWRPSSAQAAPDQIEQAARAAEHGHPCPCAHVLPNRDTPAPRGPSKPAGSPRQPPPQVRGQCPRPTHHRWARRRRTGPACDLGVRRSTGATHRGRSSSATSPPGTLHHDAVVPTVYHPTPAVHPRPGGRSSPATRGPPPERSPDEAPRPAPGAPPRVGCGRRRRRPRTRRAGWCGWSDPRPGCTPRRPG
jgi:hypothetical protein